MTSPSTTIRVSAEQRDRLRRLAAERDASMADTLDAALESLRRQQFYDAMVSAEAQLRRDPAAWDAYVRDRDAWLNVDLST
jgi:cyclopropane fatty-acyl-phospholipid synthase-like methyltransferase